MLRPSTLKTHLAQANTFGVKSTLLVNKDGCLVNYAGAQEREARVNSAIAVNIWSAYEKSGQLATSSSGKF